MKFVLRYLKVFISISRACWNYEHEARPQLGCTTFDAGWGKEIIRCFCDTDGCNGGTRINTSLSVMIALILSFFLFK